MGSLNLLIPWKLLLSQFVENLTEPKHDWRMKLQQLHKIIHQMLVVIRSGSQGVRGGGHVRTHFSRNSPQRCTREPRGYMSATCLVVGVWKIKWSNFFMTEEIVSEPRDVASAKNIQLFRPLTSSEDIWKSAMNGQFIKEEKGIKRLLKGLFLPIAHSEVL